MHNPPTKPRIIEKIPTPSINLSQLAFTPVLKLKHPCEILAVSANLICCSQIHLDRSSSSPQRDRCSNVTSFEKEHGISRNTERNGSLFYRRFMQIRIAFIKLKDISSGDIVENVWYKSISSVRHIETFYWSNGDIYFYYCSKVVAIKYNLCKDIV